MKSGINAGIDIEIDAPAQLPAVQVRMATCAKCHSNRLYRVERRTYEKTLRFLGLHPYVCDQCGRRALMAGRYSPFNWRRVRIVVTVRSRFLKSGVIRPRDAATPRNPSGGFRMAGRSGSGGGIRR